MLQMKIDIINILNTRHDWNLAMKRLLALTLISTAAVAATANDTEFTLTIKNHTFEPKEIVLPANKKVSLIVINLDDTPAEFESHPLNREKIIPAKSRAVIKLGPLNAGRYPFFEEFHQNHPGAQGHIVVR